MDGLYGLWIFVLVAICYLFLTHEYKSGQDLEVYEMDPPTNPAVFLESTSLNQPLIFPSPFHGLSHILDHLEHTHKLKLKIKDVHEYPANPNVFPMPASQTLSVFGQATSKKTKHYLSEGNGEFLEDCGILRKTAVAELRKMLTLPSSPTSKPYADILLGMQGVSTPVRYHTATRKCLVVTNGRIRIKMAPWKYTKFLVGSGSGSGSSKHGGTKHTQYDDAGTGIAEHRASRTLETLEREVVDIPFLEFDVLQNHIVFLPKLWWYSIYFPENETVVLDFTQRSYVNQLAYFGETLGGLWHSSPFSSFFSSNTNTRPRPPTPLLRKPLPKMKSKQKSKQKSKSIRTSKKKNHKKHSVLDDNNNDDDDMSVNLSVNVLELEPEPEHEILEEEPVSSLEMLKEIPSPSPNSDSSDNLILPVPVPIPFPLDEPV